MNNQTKPSEPAAPIAGPKDTAEIPLELQLEARTIAAELARAERNVLLAVNRQRELAERLEKAEAKIQAVLPKDKRLVFDEGCLRYTTIAVPSLPVVFTPKHRRRFMAGGR
ncbi:MAG TPA: hypothetical protein VN442_25805 [Bryobacteraceae bacterium]|nr:hypothetical protein [Bryobacteraceae bacterium]